MHSIQFKFIIVLTFIANNNNKYYDEKDDKTKNKKTVTYVKRQARHETDIREKYT